MIVSTFLGLVLDMKVICTIRQLKNTVMKWKNYGNHLRMMRNRNG